MSAPQQISFFDTASRLTGWCSGTGETRPDCGAFVFPDYGDDLGALGWAFRQRLTAHCELYQPSVIGYEAPILRPKDTLLKVRKLYGLGFELETFAAEHGISCFEKNHRAMKSELTGNQFAEKTDMVCAALNAGITLPERGVDGREDAADAFAGWLLGLRDLSPALSRKWDAIIHGRKGALL